MNDHVWIAACAISFVAGVGMVLVTSMAVERGARPPPLTCTCSCQDDVATLEITEPTIEGKQ